MGCSFYRGGMDVFHPRRYGDSGKGCAKARERFNEERSERTGGPDETSWASVPE
jgi:hypothetical protein